MIIPVFSLLLPTWNFSFEGAAQRLHLFSVCSSICG